MSQKNTKEEIFQKIVERLRFGNLSVIIKDDTRPWGGFFVLDETQAQQFSNTYFDGLDVNELKISGKLSPKILIVAPNTRLSWQYHDRRAEIWKIVDGTAGVITSDTDTEGELKKLSVNDMVKLKQGERHRLVGLDDWAVVAEIWQHTDPENPSDESDIVRVQDDFGR